MRLALCFLVATTLALVIPTVWPREPEPRDSDLAAAATQWVGAGTPQAPRRDGDEWEVDVLRPNGSLVEVTLGNRRELLGLDEEAGPGRSPAPDELTGASRERAARAALAVTGPGAVLSVEREPGGAIEVGIHRRAGDRVEVGLVRRFRLLELEPEDRRDE
jgi:hypothetical protein